MRIYLLIFAGFIAAFGAVRWRPAVERRADRGDDCRLAEDAAACVT
jgi:hypothetical protein